uniref:DNA primase/helicase n=1 Tax=Candidatus Kentrum sp. TUN TaxID=2126343 RepID=A0A450ZKB4_9GAMM|nr:MAG: Protein of unknown function (DUF3987) [Candidatus Kentron sp. TUN]
MNELLKNAVLPQEDWQEPQPLSAKVEPEPYPIDALPDTIRAAVEEVQGFVNAPLPLVASSALGVLSLACQAHIDVKRAEKLHGPVGLFLLTIADSGERKTTCDNFFTSAIKTYQEEQAQVMQPEIKRHKAETDAWKAKCDGLLSAIKEAKKKGNPTEELETNFTQLQSEEPKSPRVPDLVIGDETPENLAWRLARQWPSAGVMSSEAGLIFGAHGMGKDSIMRNLTLLNTLWDGGEHSIGRRTSESFTVKDARLTMALQIQEATLRDFFGRSGELARGTGFLARFLVAWPEFTQGTRFFNDPPSEWPHLTAFHKHIAGILAHPVPMMDDGTLSPVMLTLSPEAKKAWIKYYDTIEMQLQSGGALYNVRDVASKSADNAARLAALFHQFEHSAGEISLEAMECASRIAAWHLNESRRFFGELSLPVELADAVSVDNWLINYCGEEQIDYVSKNHVRQYGPLRNGNRLNEAINELMELDRVQSVQKGRQQIIKINPALFEMPR